MKTNQMLLFLVVIATSQNTIAQSEPADFSPYFYIDAGTVLVNFDDYQTYDQKAYYDMPIEHTLKLAVSYQFTPQWSATINALGKMDYDTQFSSFEGNYTYDLNSSWQVDFSVGLLFGRGTKVIAVCQEENIIINSSLPPNCEFTNESDSVTTYTLGSSIMYNLSESWGVKFGYKNSGYRAGTNQFELLMQYRF